MWKVQLFKLNFDRRESEAVESVLNSGWLTMGAKTKEFEDNFLSFCGADDAIAVANGTAALHLAMLAAGVGPTDEVIIPALTFVADANAVKLVGARPVLADSTSLDDWNVSAATIEKKITPRTKAVLVVHYAGYPCDMSSIAELCADRGLTLIEDAAHAPGASWDGVMCGSWGDYGCFSFFSNKNLSVGEGGMVTTKAGHAQRIRHLRSHGMTTLTLDRHLGRAVTYDVAMPGLNYRMDEIHAALGIVQLSKLEAGNMARKTLTEQYRSRLKESRYSVPFVARSEKSKSSYHILPVMLPNGSDRAYIMERMKLNGIQSSIHYPPFWTFSAYAREFERSDAPVASDISERQLTLPLYPTMTSAEVDYVCDSLLSVTQ